MAVSCTTVFIILYHGYIYTYTIYTGFTVYRVNVHGIMALYYVVYYKLCNTDYTEPKKWNLFL